jgi:ribosome-binding factor A
MSGPAVVDRRDRRWGSPSGGPRYPRTLRINHLLQQVVAEEIERLGDDDPRLALVTVTGVKVDPDLRHATVWLSSLSDAARDALGEDRVRLQAAIGRQVRMKRTPQLAFAADPAVAQGARVEDILHGLPRRDDGHEEHDQP